MLDRFNLLISTSRGNERNACTEAWYLLKEAGDDSAQVDVTQVIGLLVAETKIPPLETVERLRGVMRSRPWEFKYLLKVVPIELVVSTGLGEVEEAARRLSERIGEGETFRITVEKRHSNLSTVSIIEAAARPIKRKVNLKNPDRILHIEVLGKVTGISLIKPDEILSVEREKRLL